MELLFIGQTYGIYSNNTCYMSLTVTGSTILGGTYGWSGSSKYNKKIYLYSGYIGGVESAYGVSTDNTWTYYRDETLELDGITYNVKVGTYYDE